MIKGYIGARLAKADYNGVMSTAAIVIRIPSLYRSLLFATVCFARLVATIILMQRAGQKQASTATLHRVQAIKKAYGQLSVNSHYKQWGRATNNQSKSFALKFSTVYAAVCIGYENSTPDAGDGAPRIKVLSTSAITTNTGFNVNDSKVSMFIAIGK